jgi:uncharacterized protein (TIGR03083 family)
VIPVAAGRWGQSARYLRDMPDIGIVYGSCRERMTEMVRALDPARAATRVAATEDWTVHDVLAHQVGVVSDVNSGNLAGIGTDAWTAAQVAARVDASITDLIAEWEQGAAQFEATLTALGGGQAAVAVADIWNHEQDLRGTLGVEGGRDLAAEQLAIEGYCTLRAAQFTGAGLAPLQLRAGVDEWQCGEGVPTTTVIAEPYELARIICGRRTPDQLRTYLWDGDPEPYIAALAASAPSAPLPT